jgi:hypothetical protein
MKYLVYIFLVVVLVIAFILLSPLIILALMVGAIGEN